MKMRGLRRKKKSPDEGTNQHKNNENNNNSSTPQSLRKGFRRRFMIPPQVVVTSPLHRFRVVSSDSASRAMSGLTAEEEEESFLLYTQQQQEEDVNTKKLALISPSSWTTTPATTTSSSLTAFQQEQHHQHFEEMGLIDSVGEWLDALGGLVQSSEFQRVLSSSGHLLLAAGGAFVQTASLPVTLPLHVAHTTTRLVVNNCVVKPIFSVTQLLLLLQQEQQPQLLQEAESSTTLARQSVREEEDSKNMENEQHGNPIVHVARGVWCFPGHVAGLANHVKDQVGGIVLRALALPTLQDGTREESSCRAGESTAEARQQQHAHVLERLRLDYTFDSSSSPLTEQRKEPVKISQFLLRIDDLRVATDNDDDGKGSAYYVDLCALEDPTVLQSLERLVHVGLELIANHPTVRLSNQPHVTAREQEIEWKSEGNTCKLLRRLSKLDVLGRLDTLCKETLVWSGRFKHDLQSGYDRQSRFYLARGVINMSPRALLDLLWDNSRTAEYNKFCLGRTTLAGNDSEFLQGLDKTGTKVIQSETRVPLTSISVTVKCLMHARALPDNAGYIIVSRSCTTGPQGVHFQPLKNVSRPKNEIHWGVNILRRVPNRQDLVDLTCHSQVGTAGVPQFLAAKIALMGVEGFFENARKLAA